MKKALSWAPCSGVWAASSRQTAELFFWTKLASFQRKPKLRSCAYYKSGQSSGLAATNADLKTAVAQGAFRQELLYRLNFFPVEVPSLRERLDDIPLLVEYF